MCRSVTTKILLVTEASWVSLVEHVIWPVTVLVLVLALRRQIGEFLSTVGGRIKQVSVMSVTIELAVATEMVPSWRGTGGEDVRGLAGLRRTSTTPTSTRSGSRCGAPELRTSSWWTLKVTARRNG